MADFEGSELRSGINEQPSLTTYIEDSTEQLSFMLRVGRSSVLNPQEVRLELEPPAEP